MDKVVLVTGGARGIGAATCRRAAQIGYKVAVNYRADKLAARSVVSEIEAAGGRAVVVQADVGVEADVARMFSEVAERLGAPTALVNSAGVSSHSLTADFDAAALTRMMAVNVIGTMICCREAVRAMSTQRGGQGGSIVNVSSMAATIGGRPGASAYAASKAAVDAFTRGLAKEVATDGIRVNAVRPGVTITDMTAAVRDDAGVRAAIEATIAMNRTAEPDEIAAPILWLLSNDASFISGAHLDASGGGFVIGASTSPN
ncbi:MAG: SDR family oxidoreductase [Pseudomonadota bacterium]